MEDDKKQAAKRYTQEEHIVYKIRVRNSCKVLRSTHRQKAGDTKTHHTSDESNAHKLGSGRIQSHFVFHLHFMTHCCDFLTSTSGVGLLERQRSMRSGCVREHVRKAKSPSDLQRGSARHK